MAIYRGAGGAGDATKDSSSQAAVVSDLVTQATNSANAASSSATSASSSASSASTSATSASTSATAAASSATSASGSASTATTQASNASTSASTATTQASNASTSATNAASSASSATSSASAASTSATNASNSATAASAAQTAAESARDSALSAYDNFDDRYLGPKASDPTLDNDGNALLTGALYYNTASSVMRVYTGSAWVAAYVSAAGVLLSASNLSDVSSASTSRTNLGVAIGSNVQAWDADLDAIAAIAGTSGLLKKTAANTWSLDTSTYLTSAVTSVTGTSPVVSSGGTTPAISIPAATTAVNGYLTSTDWTTFNGKQAALVSGTNIKTVNSTSLLGSGDVSVGVTSVTGTAPVVSSGGATPAISMPAATTAVSGYLTSTDWTTFNNKGSGSVTAVSVASANGFTGTSSGGATPALTLTTSITGVLKGNGTAISAGTAGTDYVAPATATNFTAQQYFGNVALTDGATVAWAANTAQVATFTFVSSNRTMGAPTGLVNGAFYALAVIQNGGSNTLSWNSVFKWTGGTAPTLSTAASAKDYFTFRSDGTNLYEQGRSLGAA